MNYRAKKQILSFLVFFISISLRAQNCDLSTLKNQPGKWVKDAEENTATVSKQDLPAERKIIETINQLFYTNLKPAGANLHAGANYNSHSPDFDVNNKNLYGNPYKYHIQNMGYYCSNGTMQTETETGNALWLNINSTLAMQEYDTISVMKNGKLNMQLGFGFYTLTPQLIANKKLPEANNGFYFFENTSYANSLNSTWWFTRNSQLPFSYVSRKEFIEKQIQIQLAEIGNAKAYMNKIKDPSNEFQNKLMAGAEAMLKLYREELKKPADWLNQNSIVKRSEVKEGRTFIGYKYDFVTEVDAYALVPVKPNPSYYNRKLPRSAPQLIRIELKGKTAVAAIQTIKKIINDNAGKFVALVNGGAVPSAAPEELLVSNYKRSNLTKLKEPEPVIYPAGFKSSLPPVATSSNVAATPLKVSYQFPARSSKLTSLPASAPTAAAFKTLIDELAANISAKLSAAEKTAIDNALKTKKIVQPDKMANTALGVWLQNSPRASLYIFCKSLQANPANMLAANNLSSLLITYGSSEKAIPLLQYINKQKPGEAVVLSNIANAYYNLGDFNTALDYAQQCLGKDSLHATVNKIAAFTHLKKSVESPASAGAEIKKAMQHLKKSLKSHYDSEASNILDNIEKNHRSQEDFGNTNTKEFPLLKRITLPAMPSSLDVMKEFYKDLEVERQSLSLTADQIQERGGVVETDYRQVVNDNIRSGAAMNMAVKANQILMESALFYSKMKTDILDIFRYNLKSLSAAHNAKINSIAKSYNAQLSKLEGGEAGDEDKIDALERAKCKAINAEKTAYLSVIAELTNQYARKAEVVSRIFYRDIANWEPIQTKEKNNKAILNAQYGYLKDVREILTSYPVIEPCEYGSGKEDENNRKPGLKKWEDTHCPNFKGSIGLGPVKIKANCNSIEIEGGEGFIGGTQVTFNDDASVKEITISAGVGAGLHLGSEQITALSTGASAKEFITIGNNGNGKWEVSDWGIVSEATAEGNIGAVSGEVSVVEISVAVNAGVGIKGAVGNALGLD